MNDFIRTAGINIERERLNDKMYFMKKLFELIINHSLPDDSESIQWRVSAIKYFEIVLKKEFVDTHDFKQKVGDYLKGYDLRKPANKERIKKARKKLGLTQKNLALQLGYKSHVPIAQFESGTRSPSSKVIEWLEKKAM